MKRNKGILVLLAIVLLAALTGCRGQGSAGNDEAAVNIYELGKHNRHTLVRSIAWEERDTLTNLAKKLEEMLNSTQSSGDAVELVYQVEFVNHNADGTVAQPDILNIGFSEDGYVVGNADDFGGRAVAMVKSSMTQDEFMQLVE